MNGKVIAGLVKKLLPVVLVIFLFFIRPLFGVIALVLLLAYWTYKNLPSIYSYLGNMQYVKGNMEKAEVLLKKAYLTGRAGPKFISGYGYVLLKAGKVDEAYGILNKLVSSTLSTDDLMHAKSNLALVIWKKGDLDGAVNMLEEIFSNYKTTTIYGSLGYLLILKGDLNKALEFNLEAYDYNGSNSVIADNLGQTYYLLDELDKAREIYEKLMESNPAFPEAYYNYGLVMEALEEHDKAVELLEKALTYRFTYLSTISRNEVEAKLNELRSLSESMN